MNVGSTPEAWDEYLHWQKHDKKLLRRINELIQDTTRNPFEGKGKPERLKYQLQGCWSRRINQEHRLVYEIDDYRTVRIIACRFHY